MNTLHPSSGTLPVVGIPGTLCNLNLWKEIQHSLPESFLSVETEGDSLEAAAAAILKKVPERFILLGFSLGGIIAFEMLRQAPQRIGGLILIGVNPHPLAGTAQKGVEEKIRRVRSGEMMTLVKGFRPLYLGRINQDNEPLFSSIIKMADTFTPDQFIDQLQISKIRPQSLSTLKKQDPPTLLICGEEDCLCPPEFHREIAKQLTSVTLQIIPHAGHFALLEEPEEVGTTISKWLTLFFKKTS